MTFSVRFSPYCVLHYSLTPGVLCTSYAWANPHSLIRSHKSITAKARPSWRRHSPPMRSYGKRKRSDSETRVRRLCSRPSIFWLLHTSWKLETPGNLHRPITKPVNNCIGSHNTLRQDAPTPTPDD